MMDWDWALWFLIACLAASLVVVVVLPLRSWLEYRRERRRRLLRYLNERPPSTDPGPFGGGF
jgi:hypothetical protein